MLRCLHSNHNLTCWAFSEHHFVSPGRMESPYIRLSCVRLRLSLRLGGLIFLSFQECLTVWNPILLPGNQYDHSPEMVEYRNRDPDMKWPKNRDRKLRWCAHTERLEVLRSLNFSGYKEEIVRDLSPSLSWLVMFHSVPFVWSTAEKSVPSRLDNHSYWPLLFQGGF